MTWELLMLYKFIMSSQLIRILPIKYKLLPHVILIMLKDKNLIYYIFDSIIFTKHFIYDYIDTIVFLFFLYKCAIISLIFKKNKKNHYILIFNLIIIRISCLWWFMQILCQVCIKTYLSFVLLNKEKILIQKSD